MNTAAAEETGSKRSMSVKSIVNRDGLKKTFTECVRRPVESIIAHVAHSDMDSRSWVTVVTYLVWLSLALKARCCYNITLLESEEEQEEET